jgi:ABC-type multidrug transport system ATPase subunit
MGEPEVLFLDEPTTGLDPASRLTVWAEVRRINGRGTTVFLTTQYLEEADQVCDRIAIIDDGRIVREGTPAQLKTELQLRLGLAVEPTLDDVFLDATGRSRVRVEGDVREVGAHPHLLPRREPRAGRQDISSSTTPFLHGRAFPSKTSKAATSTSCAAPRYHAPPSCSAG